MWLVIVSIMSWLTSIRCFLDPLFPIKRMYTRIPISTSSGLNARFFALWVLLAGIIRFLCAIQPQNKALYACTLFTFIIAFFHFLSESLIYRTAYWYKSGIYSPLIISCASVIWMIYRWNHYHGSRRFLRKIVS
jgi:CHASE2 domain-containing sensor protein